MKQELAQQFDRIAREDLVMFINACLTCTGQREFYDDSWGQRVSIDFLHDYIMGNYRLLYARTLAAGINHFNQAQIILKLLATGKKTDPKHRAEENALITTALHSLPPQRAWKVLEQLRKRGINNRRSRAIASHYLTSRGDRLAFQVVKYRSKVRAIATHAHFKLDEELGAFIFRQWKRQFQTPLFEQFRQGFYSAKAIYELPFTVAESLAMKHNIDRDRFLTSIEQQMTVAEKLRIQGSAERADTEIKVDWHRLPLTKLALYVLSLEERGEELETALVRSARITLKKAPLQLKKVAAVLDCSYSSSGSSEKRRRPLGVALAAHYLLQAAAEEYQAFWTIPVSNTLEIKPRGQTDLATPLLAALSQKPDLIAIVSDGWENDPPCGAAEILRIYRTKLDPQRRVSIVHCNPVFNSADFTLKTLSPLIPTVGLRDAEDLPTVLGFARFAEGTALLSELEEYLAIKAQQLIEK
jgi:hypothetical protein